jgi:hypothetical protein
VSAFRFCCTTADTVAETWTEEIPIARRGVSAAALRLPLVNRAWSRASEASIGQYDPQLRHIVRKKQQQNTPSVIFFKKTANYIYLQQLQSPIQYYESQSTNIDFISHRTNHITSQMYINSIYNAKYSFSFTVSYKLPQVSIAHKSNINLETSATSGASSCLDPGTTRCGDGVDQISYLRRSGFSYRK